MLADAALTWHNDAPPRDRPVVLLLRDGLTGRYSAVVAEHERHANGFFDRLGQQFYYVAWHPLPPFPKESA
jgi:hypothetical protein